jgi:hypothetical protein
MFSYSQEYSFSSLPLYLQGASKRISLPGQTKHSRKAQQQPATDQPEYKQTTFQNIPPYPIFIYGKANAQYSKTNFPKIRGVTSW